MSEDKIPYITNRFITIKEACILTGKSSVTIRRLIKRVEWENVSAISQVIKQEITPAGFVYKISQDFLIKELKPLKQVTTQPLDQVPTQNEKLTTQATTQDEELTTQNEGLITQMSSQNAEISNIMHKKGENVTTQNEGLTMQMTSQLTNQIVVMQNFIELISGQLKTKDDQIQQLMRSQERSDILLKGLQDKIFLIERNN